MPRLSLLTKLSIPALLAAIGAHAFTPAPDLRIMLQGTSAEDMRELIETNDGSVTHYLPIINAVGARVSQTGLDNILRSPKVDRHLDDLSIATKEEPEDTEEDIEQCDVGGALEIRYSDSGMQWQLFNKMDQPARLRELAITWPEQLGRLTKVQLGRTNLTIPETTEKRLVLTFRKMYAPSFQRSAHLQFNFSTPFKTQAQPGVKQSDFEITARFIGGCETKLVPGYEDNPNDTYFPTVIGADTLHQHGVTGRGVTVAIIDSGLWSHRSLTRNTKGEYRVLAQYDAINDSYDDVFDESGHGTHMASVLAHSGPVSGNAASGKSYKGVAPDASIVAVKAFNVEGQGDFLDIVRAIQFVVDNKDAYNIRVLNLSFAARPRWLYWQDPINQAVMKAWDAGITVVAAAGNEGPDPMTIGSPGNLPYVITVGAVTDSWTTSTTDDDYIPDFSSRGPTPEGHIKPDVVAPGGHMTGLTRLDSTLAREHPEYFLKSGEFVMTGSSQAAALVSGVVALLLQLEPDLSPDDVKCKLMSSTQPAINADGLLSYSPFEQGDGYVSATRAVTLGQRGCGNDGLDLAKDIANIQHFEGPAIIDEQGDPSLPGLSAILSPLEPARGLSFTRKWGVKQHIERAGYQWQAGKKSDSKPSPPINWESIYLQEKTKIEALSQ